MSMPQRAQTKAFGASTAESKMVASATPLPPIVEPQPTVEDESVKMTLDTKTVLPPISGDNLGDNSEKVVEIKSPSSLAEPLPPITSPAEVKDSEATEASSGAVETGAELIMKEDVTPLPPITPKQADSAIKFGDVYFVLG